MCVCIYIGDRVSGRKKLPKQSRTPVKVVPGFSSWPFNININILVRL